MECKFKKENIFWKFCLNLFLPITLAILGFLGGIKTNDIQEKMNKSSLLATFKNDLIVGYGPSFIIAQYSLKPYFNDKEWSKLITEITLDKNEQITNTKDEREKLKLKKAILNIFDNQEDNIIKALPKELKKQLTTNEKIYNQDSSDMKSEKFQQWFKGE